jgi:hypothetical protein
MPRPDGEKKDGGGGGSGGTETVLVGGLGSLGEMNGREKSNSVEAVEAVNVNCIIRVRESEREDSGKERWSVVRGHHHQKQKSRAA